MKFRQIALAPVATLLVALGAAGCKANPPRQWEAKIATGAKRYVFVGGSGDKNPLLSNPQNIEAGRVVFSYYCVACHGFDGQNTGVPFADNMSPPVPNLNSRHVQAYSDGQLKWIVDNGIWPSGMPRSRGTLTETEIWQTVLYIRNLPPAGSLGEPSIYSGDPPKPSSQGN